MQPNDPTPTRFVAYYRVSTKQQGRSGLGLDAQRADVAHHVARCGGSVLKDFQEIETGKLSTRPRLIEALAFARRSGATLIVAKLDRLSRNLAFTSALMESGVDFVCCDNPNANKLTIHILAAMAEHEAQLISARTKAGLAQAKARGTLLGSARQGHWDGREDRRRAGSLKGVERAATLSHARALAELADLLPIVRTMRAENLSLRKIAERLNADGHKTRSGRPWTFGAVRRLLNLESKGV